MNQAKKLLVVEDDENIAKLLHLREEGFTVTHGADVPERAGQRLSVGYFVR